MSDYDRIGTGYARVRRPDPRIAAAIREALGDAKSVINVGAGAGSYEPRDLEVVAVEPSETMIAQRPADAAPVVQASAERLPFADDSFDAAMAVLTIHHWADWRRGLAEMRRVARCRVVVLTWDPDPGTSFWLFDYLASLAPVDAARFMATADLVAALGPCRVVPVAIPEDCTDGFLAAYWKRPRAYLDPEVRAGISAFCLGVDVGPGLAKLAEELDDGRWAQRWRDVLACDRIDAGYRLIVCDANVPPS